MRLLLASLLATTLISQAALAQERTRLGFGFIANNDLIGDGKDRWRTGSVASSRVWGTGWDGVLPTTFGDLIELRIGGEIITPSNISGNTAGDRPYVGALSLGAHTHFERRALEYSMGADLVVTGPATQLDELQSAIHDLVNIRQPSDAVKDSQIANGLHPTAVIEVGRTFSFGQTGQLRPFVEGRAGVETMLRAGFALTLGQLGNGELLVRDPTTGQRYRAIDQEGAGYSFVLGADVAHVADSTFFPDSSGVTVSDSRERVRAGVHWQNDRGAAAFYGLTWLGEEFEGQSDTQLVGSVRLRINF